MRDAWSDNKDIRRRVQPHREHELAIECGVETKHGTMMFHAMVSREMHTSVLILRSTVSSVIWTETGVVESAA